MRERGWNDRSASVCVGIAVAVVYWLTFASVPTSDGQSFVWMLERALSRGVMEFPPQDNISNAPFTFFVVFWLQRAGVPLTVLATFQAVSAVATGVGCAVFYGIVRLAGNDVFWALVGAGLLAGSYGVWYFANGEVHHVALTILIVLFYVLAQLRRVVAGRPRYLALAGLGTLNAIAVFFHQEHFIFGFTAIALLAWRRPLGRAVREIVVYAITGSVGTFLLIYAVGRTVMRLQTAREIADWYFATLLVRAAHEIVLEPARTIVLRLVKGQLTALDFGVQVIVDALDGRVAWTAARVSAYSVLTLAALALAAALAGGLWAGRRYLTGERQAIAVGALVWLVSFPALLWWYYPAVTEYYLKTLPPLVLLLILGGSNMERLFGSARLVAVALLILIAGTNALTAIVPWYRYGLLRDRVAASLPALAGPGALAVSVESGIDSVLTGRIDQLAVKNLLYEQGEQRGFETIREQIAERIESGRGVLVYNLVPSRWALEGLADSKRNPFRDTYRAADFEALQSELERRYRLVPVFEYWEESKEPLYLFGQRLEPVFAGRPR